MRISVKGRYALAAAISMAGGSLQARNVSVNSIAEILDISKIYLEQVFSQLKKSGIVMSVKGPKGGYQLAKPSEQITAWDVLSALEQSLTEQTEATVADSDPGLESVLRTRIFSPLDDAIKKALSSITIRDLAEQAEQQDENLSFMLNM
jgi:Rrf2 family protein